MLKKIVSDFQEQFEPRLSKNTEFQMNPDFKVKVGPTMFFLKADALPFEPRRTLCLFPWQSKTLPCALKCILNGASMHFDANVTVDRHRVDKEFFAPRPPKMYSTSSLNS